MSSSKPILIIGGTRGTGLAIAQQLVTQRRSVRVLARDPERARQRLDRSIEIIYGDITRAGTLPAALAGTDSIFLTAGCRSARPAREATVQATEYEGVRNVLNAAHAAGFGGRLLYLTAGGVTRRSFSTIALNLYKGNTLLWRRRAEAEIRNSSIDYTIIRAAFLTNGRRGRHRIIISQTPLPFISHRIGRPDLADVFIAAADHPKASRATFEVAWGSDDRPLTELLDALKPDALTVLSQFGGRP